MKSIVLSEKDIAGFRDRLIAWYGAHKRSLPWRRTGGVYPLWVSEVMLQQTQVATVIPYFERFMNAYPTVKDLARADLQSVLKIWEGLGYYARARNLHKAARMVLERFGGKIPETYREFKKLPGVGEYIAAAVMSIAYQQPYAVVDGNVKRVLSRVLIIGAPVNDASSQKVFQTAANRLLDPRRPGDFNQALMELGALCCRPKNPLCNECPVNELCTAFQKSGVSEYPVKRAYTRIPTYHIAVGVIRKDGKLLITRRKEDGLLGGLWEFPGGKVESGENAEAACVREIHEEVNLQVEVASHLTRVRHAYTHFKIVMDVYLCRYISGSVQLQDAVDYRWITRDEISDFPFPRANHKFIPLLFSDMPDR